MIMNYTNIYFLFCSISRRHLMTPIYPKASQRYILDCLLIITIWHYQRHRYIVFWSGLDSSIHLSTKHLDQSMGQFLLVTIHGSIIGQNSLVSLVCVLTLRKLEWLYWLGSSQTCNMHFYFAGMISWTINWSSRCVVCVTFPVEI